MKEEALDRTLWRFCFGRGYGTVVNKLCDYDHLVRNFFSLSGCLIHTLQIALRSISRESLFLADTIHVSFGGITVQKNIYKLRNRVKLGSLSAGVRRKQLSVLALK